MQLFWKLSIALGLSLLIGAGLFAQPPGPGPRGPMMMKMVDTNADGKIQTTEWKAHFTAMDANKDSLVDADEIRAHHRAHMGQMMGGMGKGPGAGRTPQMIALMDANKDAKISVAEWEAHFKAMDANKDGTLDQKEFEAHQKKMWG